MQPAATAKCKVEPTKSHLPVRKLCWRLAQHSTPDLSSNWIHKPKRTSASAWHSTVWNKQWRPLQSAWKRHWRKAYICKKWSQWLGFKIMWLCKWNLCLSQEQVISKRKTTSFITEVNSQQEESQNKLMRRPGMGQAIYKAADASRTQSTWNLISYMRQMVFSYVFV